MEDTSRGQSTAKSPGLWAWLNEKVDPALYRPAGVPGTVVSRLTGREGEYYVLKNPTTKTYYRLSDRDHFLWQRMDGTAAVKDLVVAYFMEYGSFAFSRVAALVQGLKAGQLLAEQPVDIYRQVRSRLAARRPGHRVTLVFQAFLQKQFAINGLDRFVSGVYRWGGRLLFSRPLQVLFLVVCAAGLYAFVRALGGGQYGVVTIGGSLVLGIIGLIVANLLAVFLHEMAHALTVKHYGRQVRRGGFMIYFGMPAFFVDTTDIWLEGKRARLAVTWAGPHSGLILGGLASIVLLLWPEFTLNPLLFQFAVLTYLTVFLNLNPLLELDGYYLLMDWLEIPMLRHKSLEFIRAGLWQKMTALRDAGTSTKAAVASLSREERIFSIFGLLSGLWTLYAIYLGVYFWQQRLSGALRDLWAQGSSMGKIILSLGIAVLALLFILSIGLAVLGAARGILRWASRRGLFANTWYLAGTLMVIAAALTAVPVVFGYPAWAPLLSLLALTAGTVFAWRAVRVRAGSRLSRVFWLVGLFVLLLLLEETAHLAGGLGLLGSGAFSPVAYALGILAYLSLLLAGLLLFGDTNLRELYPVEKGVLGLGLGLSYGLVLWQASVQQSASLPLVETAWVVGSSLVPLLVLTLLTPTLFSFWRTAFAPAWVMLALALAGLVGVALLGFSPLLPYLLIAAGLLLHDLAYRQITYLRGRPEARLDLNDQQRLQRAFAWTVNAILSQFHQTAGERSGRVLAERLNNYAVAAGWQVSVTRDRVEDYLAADLSLIERGEAYAAALSLLLDLVSQEVGEKPTVRALQRAYDGLPWEEREVGTQYLFRDVKRAEALGRAFQATRQDYRGLLQRMPLFATMSDQEIDLLVSRLKPERHVPGKAIIRQGEQGDRFYVVRRGHVEVTQRDDRGVTDVVNQLDRGDYFGELALLHDAARNATCRATVPTQTLALSRQDFDALVKARFALREKVDQSLVRAELLRRLPLFAELDGLQIQQTAAQLQEVELEAGAVFIQQGDLGETFYVIESGRVQVFVSQEGVDRVVAERGPGEYVGEIALSLKVPRTASVRTLEPTRLLTLHKDEFDRLVSEHLFIRRGLQQESSRRMIDLRRAVPQA